MKSFFKKLSLVLAAAMIITLIPAQQTKAAGATLVYTEQAEKDKTKAITYKTLKVGETVDLKVWNATDWKTNGKGWVSSEQGVATVDKTGLVKAIAVGTTEVIYDCAGHDQQPVLIQVVGDYTVDIVNQDKNNEKVTAYTLEKVGDKVDFGFLGAKGYTVSKFACNWASSDKKVATVDNKGVVTAVAAGTATISLTITEKATGKVAFAVKPVEVTVKAEAATAKLAFVQTGYNTASLTADGKMIGDQSKIKLFSVENEVKTEKYDFTRTDGKDKAFDVITFLNEGIENGKTYIVEYEGASAQITGNVGKLAKFDIVWKSAAVEGAKETDGKAYVDASTTISLANFRDNSDLTVEQSSTWVKELEITRYSNGVAGEARTYEDGDSITLDEKEGVKVVATVKDSEGKVLATATQTITADKVPSIAFTTVDFKISTTAGKDYDKADATSSAVISLSDGDSWKLAAKITDNRNVTNKFAAGTISTADTAWEENYGAFVFKSSNPSVLDVVDDGTLVVNAKGNATISLYYEYVDDNENNKSLYLKSVSFQVKDKRKASSIVIGGIATDMNTASSNTVTLTDIAGPDEFNTARVTVVVKDQFGAEMNNQADKIKVKANKDNYDEYFNVSSATSDGWGGRYTVVLTANSISGVDVASYTTTLTFYVKDGADNATTTLKATAYNWDYKNATAMKQPSAYIKKNGAKGLGVTDNRGNVAAVTQDIYLVDVKKFSNIVVYGPETNIPVYEYQDAIGTETTWTKTVNNKTETVLTGAKNASGQLLAITYANAVSNKTAFKWGVENNKITTASGKAYFVTVDKAEAYEVNGGKITVTVRNAYDNAVNIAKLSSKTYTLTVTGIDSNNKPEAMTTYISSSNSNKAFTLTNNDAANMNARFKNFDDINFVTSGDFESVDELISWFKDNTTILVNQWTDGWHYDGELALDWTNDVRIDPAKFVNDATYKAGTKYIKNIVVYYDEADGATNEIKLVIPVNKSFKIKAE